MQVKRCDDMARKLRFFTDQAGPHFPPADFRAAGFYTLQKAFRKVLLNGCPPDASGLQVEKSGLITGSRLGADREYEFDELEVPLTPSKCPADPHLQPGSCMPNAEHGVLSDAASDRLAVRQPTVSESRCNAPWADCWRHSRCSFRCQAFHYRNAIDLPNATSI